MTKYLAILLTIMLLMSSCIFPKPTPEPVAPGAVYYAVLPVKAGGTGTSGWAAGALPYVSTATASRMSAVGSAATGYFIEWNGTAPVYASVGTVGGFASSSAYTGSSTINTVGTLTSGTLGNGFTSVTYLNEGTRTSAQAATIITDETGTGLFVLNTSPSLTTPILSTATLTNAVASGTWTGGAGTFTLPAFTVVQPTITDGTIGGTTAWNSTTTIAFTHLQMTRGDTFVPAASTTYTITHGLGTTPAQVFLTWQSNPGATLSTTWVSLKGATTFQVNIPSTEAGAPSTIGWLAIP